MFSDLSKGMRKCSGNIRPVIQPYSRARAPKQVTEGLPIYTTAPLPAQAPADVRLVPLRFVSLRGCPLQFGEHSTAAVILLLGRQFRLPLSNVRNGTESKGCYLE